MRTENVLRINIACIMYTYKYIYIYYEPAVLTIQGLQLYIIYLATKTIIFYYTRNLLDFIPLNINQRTPQFFIQINIICTHIGHQDDFW